MNVILSFWCTILCIFLAFQTSNSANCPLDYDIKTYISTHNQQDLLNVILELPFLDPENTVICDKSLVRNPDLIKGLLNLEGKASTQFFDILFKNGLPVNYKLNGKSLLTCAFERDNPELFDFFLKKGADINSVPKDIGNPYLIAITKHLDNILNFLITHNFFTSYLNHDTFKTSLQRGDLKIIQLVLSKYTPDGKDYLFVLGVKPFVRDYLLKQVTYKQINNFEIPSEYKSLLSFMKYTSNLSSNNKKPKLVRAKLNQVINNGDFILENSNKNWIKSEFKHILQIINNRLKMPDNSIFSLNPQTNTIYIWSNFHYNLRKSSFITEYTSLFLIPFRVYKIKRKVFVTTLVFKPLPKSSLEYLKKKNYSLMAKALSSSWERNYYKDGPIISAKCLLGCDSDNGNTAKSSTVKAGKGSKEFICEFYCDTGESRILQVKSKDPVKVRVKASNVEEAVDFLKSGFFSSKADKICREYGYKGGLYRHVFHAFDIHCEER